MRALTAVLICLLLWLPDSLRAQAAAGSHMVRNEHATVSLVAETRTPKPGAPFTVGIRFDPQPGWHTYWQNPGDSGMETRVEWRLPDGATAGALRYPVPETFSVAGIMNYVYAHENMLLAELGAAAGTTPGTPLPVTAKVDYLVCDDSLCVPESATLSLELEAGKGEPDPAAAETFRAARAALPASLGARARFANEGERLAVAVPLDAVPLGNVAAIRAAYFFPLTEGLLQASAPQQAGLAGNALRIETAAGFARGLTEARGLLRLDLAGRDAPLGLLIEATRGAVPDSAEPLASAAARPASEEAAGGRPARAAAGTAALAFALAVAGGLLLNVMPCVFPILSLKALSLARSGRDESPARGEAVAYAAGVVLTCAALGAAILALRAAGVAAGWAFQLQDPRVILLLLLLVVLIALNLAGLFEIRVAGVGAGQSFVDRGGRSGAFWTGVLAAFVATPCTGPFMGAALGAAVVLPTLAGLLIFAGLGLGLALPFLALGFVPALRRRLPRPGPWMERFRRWMSVPMFATALALAWVLGRQAGVDGMTLGLAAALGTGLVAWWVGERQRSRAGAGGARIAVPAALALLLVAPAVTFVRPLPDGVEASEGGGRLLGAERFTAERLAALRAEGKPVFLYFTADWCITCKVNERGALASAEVARAFRERGIEVLVGDWTSGDAAIGRFLESHGRSGVPLYLFYAAGAEPRILPQLLVPSALTQLASAGQGGSSAAGRS